MTPKSRTPAQKRILTLCLASTLALSALVGARAAVADSPSFFQPDNLLVFRNVYVNPGSSLVAGVTQLPPTCTTTCVTANTDGTYPTVWNNGSVDGQFGITSRIMLDQLQRDGTPVSSFEVPNSSQGLNANNDQMAGSFSSKSEGALNLATDGKSVTFMGYLAPVGALDVSNANTEVFDATNPDPQGFYRVVGQVNQDGSFHFTKTNAYSGDNGRAAILNVDHGTKVLYTAGNAGAGSNPQPDGIIVGAGLQIMDLQTKALKQQSPGLPTPVGSFNITQLPANPTPDKIGKDTNFRGLTIFNNVLYTTKGSGSNGINSVYFVDTTGTACPTGVGLPVAGAPLPTSGIAYDLSLLQTKGVTPYNLCILKGFNTGLAKAKTNTEFPFAIWFADANTLYVSDEGDGNTTFNTTSGTYTKAAAQAGHPGLQKWVFDATADQWNRVYTLQAGLNLGQPYTVPGYPTGNNSATGLPWAPAADGIRNITGRVNGDGTVTVWGIISTVSGNGDVGADPNKLVAITDTLSATTLPASEAFTTVKAAGVGEVLRGVSLTPGTGVASSH
jgi:hypothetical protein